MAVDDRVTTGKVGELLVLAELLRRDIIPYVPLVDMGIDAVIRAEDGHYVEIQVKKVRTARWFQVQNLKAREELFIIGIEPDNAAWIIPSLVFKKYSTKSKGIYDLVLDAKPRGQKMTRGELLAPYKNNWNLLAKSLEDLEDLVAMYESLAAPEEESMSWEEYKKRRDARVHGQQS